MANTLTGLLPTLYESLDIVSRELVGFIPAVTRDAQATRAALNQSILVPVTQPTTLQNVVPGVTAPNDGDATVSSASILITNSQYASVRFNGEEAQGLLTAGTYSTIVRDRFTQGFRALANAVESTIFTAAYQSASRATGTAGTAPFSSATDMTPASKLRKILDDNGAPQSDLQLVLGSAAVANLRGYQTILLKANENGAGGSEFRRTGNISVEPLIGFDLHNSAAVQPVTPGGGTGYVTSGSTAAGVNQIALVSGSGNVGAGSVIQFAADGNNFYVVNSGITAPGTITIGAPGAEVTIGTGNAVTVGGTYTPNMGFSKSAIILVARAPAMPVGPDGTAMDMADDVMMITDPWSGLTFEVALYRQFKQLVYHISLAWGASVIKPNHVATLMG